MDLGFRAIFHLPLTPEEELATKQQECSTDTTNYYNYI
jgi:hypothetical protein